MASNNDRFKCFAQSLASLGISLIVPCVMTILWGRLWIKGFVFGIIFFWLLLPLLQGFVITLYLKTKNILVVVLLSNWYFLLIFVCVYLWEVPIWGRDSSFEVFWDFVVIPAVVLLSAVLMGCSTFFGYKISWFVINRIPWKRKADVELTDKEATKYAGFWYRAGALFIDYYAWMIPALVFSIIIAALLIKILEPFVPSIHSADSVMDLCFAMLLLSNPVYFIYCHKRWGQTFGKYAMKIKVLSTDSSHLTWKTAIIRAITHFLWVLMVITGFFFIQKIPYNSYRRLERREQRKMWSKVLPPAYQRVANLLLVWIAGEIVCVLMDKKRRSLHDFVAGTVVVSIKDKK